MSPDPFDHASAAAVLSRRTWPSVARPRYPAPFNTIHLNLRSQADVGRARALITWPEKRPLGRVHIELRGVSSDESVRFSKALIAAWNECGCRASAIGGLAALASLWICWPPSGWNAGWIGAAILSSSGAALLARLAALALAASEARAILDTLIERSLEREEGD